MSLLKLLIIFCAVFTVCYCDSTKKKKHKYELYWHGFHYLTFLAFKIKALLVLGSIFTIGLLAGKIFAVIKFAEYMKKGSKDDRHEEKIVYVSPHGATSDHGYSGPSPSSGHSYMNGGGNYQDSFPPGFSVDQPPPGFSMDQPPPGFSMDQPPPGTHMSDGDGGFNSNALPHGYGRSNSYKTQSVLKYFKLFKDMIERFNVTNMTFNNMNLKSDKCRRKFVCEADFSSQNSILLKSAFDMFSDDNYAGYKTRKNITSMDECNELYPNCIDGT